MAFIAMLTNPSPGIFLFRFKRQETSPEEEVRLTIGQTRNLAIDAVAFSMQHDRRQEGR